MVNYPIGGEFMRNILILRKTDEFAENLADGLRLNGLNVTVCNSQITAEEMLLSGDIDIAVFDVVVPGGDGIEFLKKCKELNICSICVTGFINDFVLYLCQNYGTDFVLSEGMPIETIIDRIFLFASIHSRCFSRNVEGTRNVEIVKMLDSIGIRHNRLGFRYSEKALCKMLQCNNSVPLWTIYEDIAKNEKTKPNCVERCIRSAIEEAWINNSLNIVESIFGFSVKADKGKPTNKEFLSAIYEKMRLRGI